MRILLAGLLIVHGVAHLVGFVVPWRLLASEDVPYRTTVLAGWWVDVGPTGIRLIGVAWLLPAAAFVVAAGGLLLDAPWWFRAAAVTALLSVALCILGWPDARLGIAVNAVILALLVVGGRRSWFL